MFIFCAKFVDYVQDLDQFLDQDLDRDQEPDLDPDQEPDLELDQPPDQDPDLFQIVKLKQRIVLIGSSVDAKKSNIDNRIPYRISTILPSLNPMKSIVDFL